MKTIWKYELEIDDVQEIVVPAGAQALSVQVQNGKPCLWMLVDPSLEPRYSRRFCLYGTGHSIHRDDIRFIGTFQLQGGALVFHLFEVSHGPEN